MRKSELCRASTASSALQTSAPQRAVGADEGVEGVGEHAPRPARHVLDLGIGGDGRAQGNEAQRRLGDVDGVVADAFQVAGDLDGADDEAQVARHGLLRGEQFHGQRFHVDLQGVDTAVALDDGVGLVLVAREQGVDGEVDEFPWPAPTCPAAAA